MTQLVKLPDNYKTKKVTDISFDFAPTYDAEVKNDHYYTLGNGIVSHNTLSLMFRGLVLSYGIEPAFGLYYWKRTRISGKYEYYFCVPTVVREVLEKHGYILPMKADAIRDTWDGALGRPVAAIIDEAVAKMGLKYKSAPEVSPFDKLEMMAGVMKWCDSSISVTYMLPENTNWQDVYDFILLAWKNGIKSIAAFPDRKMYGIVTYVPFKELAVKLRKEGVDIHQQNFDAAELEQLQALTNTVIESDDGIIKTNAPKRPESLNCDVHHIKFTKKIDGKAKGFDYLVIVGLLKGEPFEIFVMEDGFLDKKYVKGVNTKTKRGIYRVTFDDGTAIEDVTAKTIEEYDMFTRMISGALRHGMDISFCVDQLEKAEAEEDIKMWSISSAMARVLKKYIKDGVKIAGQTCKNCGSVNLVRIEGCMSCQDCGSSRCS